MNKNSLKIDILIVVALILIAACLRLANVTIDKFHLVPIAGLSLFAGFILRHKSLAFLVPIGAYLLTDIYLETVKGEGFYGISQIFVYGGMMLVALLGIQIKRLKALSILGFTLAGSLIFWLISNFGVFLAGYYTYSFAGLIETYAAALPFLKNEMATQLFFNAILSDLVCSGIVFGTYALVQKSLVVKATS